MNKQLFKLLEQYKYQGDYLDNYGILLNLIQTTTRNLQLSYSSDCELFAIHLVLTIRDHILGMAYSKKYEMSALEKDISENTFILLDSMDNPNIKPLRELISKVITQGNAAETDKPTTLIRYFSPWNFYLRETNNNKVLHFVNHNQEFTESSQELNSFESFRVDSEEKVYETLYSIIESARTKMHIQSAALQ